MRIIRAYVIREVGALFIVSLVIITLLFMSQRIIRLTEYAVNRGISPVYIVKLLVYHLPEVLVIIIPIVTLFSILLAVGRLSSDNEIVSLKAAGISLYRWFPSVLLFSVFAFCLGLLSSQYLAPASSRAIQSLEYMIVKTRTESAVTERTFIELLHDFTFYVKEKKPDGELRGVMASQERWKRHRPAWKLRRTIIAGSGRFVHDKDLLVNELWLQNGVLINEDRRQERNDYISFQNCRIRLDIDDPGMSSDERRKAMDAVSMRGAISRLENKKDRSGKEDEHLMKLKILWHERLAYPFGCIALCFWAVPLGIQPPRAGRSRAIIVSVFLAALFYYLMVLSTFAALKAMIPPAAAMWLPGTFILLTGLYMLRQKNLERSILMISWTEDMIYYLTDRVRDYLERRRKRR
ncbi:MAG: LptF/LptG family permease [bacterium]